MEWDYILYNVLRLSTSHDTCCPHSCMTAQKVPYPAPLCPQILAGALWFEIANVQIASIFDRVVCPSHILDDNLSKYQSVITKLGVCINFMGICFGIAFEQILSIFESSASHTIVAGCYLFRFLYLIYNSMGKFSRRQINDIFIVLRKIGFDIS